MVSRPDDSQPTGPVRTCIGCRRRAARRELLRVVAGPGTQEQDQSWAVVPDPRGTAAGRGAHLHPTLECFELAERRRAFTRALRQQGGQAPSLERLRDHLAQMVTDQPR